MSDDLLCPLMRGPCVKHACRFYISLLGKDPQKDAPVKEWDCAISFLPILLIENAQMTRQFAGSVESSRNQAATDARAVAVSVLEVANSIGDAARRAEARAVEAPPRRPGLVGRLMLAFKGEG